MIKAVELPWFDKAIERLEDEVPARPRPRRKTTKEHIEDLARFRPKQRRWGRGRK